MFLTKKNKKAIECIENFIKEANKTMNYERRDECSLEVYNFFGGYRFAVSKTPFSRTYTLIVDGSEKIVIEKELMNTIVVKKKEMKLSRLEDFLSIDFLAATPKTNQRLIKLPMNNEQI